MATTEPIRDTAELHTLADFFLEHGQYRNHALVVMGVYTALRIGDLLQLKWCDVYNETARQFRSHLSVMEQKTGKRKNIALNHRAIHALEVYYPHRQGEYLFASRKGEKPITRIQAWRIIHEAATALNLTGKISCHSLRKTWGYHAWTSQGVSPVVIMDVYNHSNYDITKRYLGVAQDDLDDAYLRMDIL